MATSKTLTPTNVTIQIPEFTDKPDQRANSNSIDKEADAINALNTKLVNPAELTITRVENNFANATSIGRLRCRKVGSTVTFHGNLALDAGTTSDFVTIATISDWYVYPEVYTTVPAQNDPSKNIVVQIASDAQGTGTVKIYSSTGIVSSFYRFFITVPYVNS